MIKLRRLINISLVFFREGELESFNLGNQERVEGVLQVIFKKQAYESLFDLAKFMKA